MTLCVEGGDCGSKQLGREKQRQGGEELGRREEPQEKQKRSMHYRTRQLWVPVGPQGAPDRVGPVRWASSILRVGRDSNGTASRKISK